MAIIHLPSSLTNYTKQQRDVEVEAKTLQDAIEKLLEQFPALKNHIVDNNSHLLLHVAVFIDGEQLDITSQSPALLKPNSQIDLLLALSGG
jgi:molybdopterin synthase sulfur carrier subunit